MNLQRRKLAGALRFLAVALFALAQALPSGLAFAANDDGLSIVICTGDGLQTVSWEELTGEPSPYQEHNPESGEQPCHACYTSCRIGAAVAGDDPQLFHPFAAHVAQLASLVVETVVVSTTRPPMPSRSPPAPAA